MNEMTGGMPPRQVPPSGGMRPPSSAIEANRSIMNPTDAAAMVQTGAISQDMTVKDLIEKVFKVPIDAPVSALTEAIKRQSANKNGLGKVQAMAPRPVGSAMGPRDGSGPNGAMANRMPPSQGARPSQGLADIMGGM